MGPESSSLDVVILPNRATEMRATELAGVLAKNFESEFTVKDSRFMPHITLYQLECPIRNLDKLKSTLSSIAKATRTLNLVAGPFEISPNNFAAWVVLPNDRLDELHRKVVQGLNPLREGLMLPHMRGDPFRSSLTPEESENLRKYGMAKVGSSYEPHITLGKLGRDVDIDAATLAGVLEERQQYEFEAKEICLGKLGDTRQGTVVGILDRFTLVNLKR